MARKFFGGIHPHAHKELSCDKLIQNFPEPEVLVVPLSQHIGAPAVPIVKVGDMVEENQMIAQAAEGLSVPHYAPISGKVTYVDAKTIVIHA